MARSLASEEMRGLLDVAAAAPAVVLVSAPTRVDAVEAIADALRAAHPGHEVRAAYPDGMRWKVSEVLSDVIDPARFAPDERRHIVVADADRALPAVHDRMLKVLEEPLSDTTVWLVHDEQRTLPDALRGRSAHQLRVRGATSGDQVAALVAAGVEQRQASDLVSAAHADLSLAWTAHRFGMHSQLAESARSYQTDTPTDTAARMLLALGHLAVAAHHRTAKAPVAPTTRKGELGSLDSSRLTAPSRTTLRRHVGRTLDRWRQEALRNLTAEPDPVAARALLTALRDLDDVARGVEFNTPLMTTLAAALAALNAAPAAA